VRHAVAIGVVAAAVAVGVAGGATNRVSLHVRPAIVSPGGVVTVYGNADGCPRGDQVVVLSRPFAGTPFAGIGTIRARVRAGGAFSAMGRIRRLARPGRYVVTARCGGGNLGVLVHIRVR
jgi:hypothetical protein